MIFEVITDKLCRKAVKPGWWSSLACKDVHKQRLPRPALNALIEQVFQRSVVGHLRQHVLDQNIRVIFRPPLNNSKRFWNMSERAFSKACVIDACIRLACKRSTSSPAIYRIAAWSSGKTRREWAVASSGRFGKGPLSLIANTCSNVSTGFRSCVWIPGFLYTVLNKGSVALFGMRLGLVATGIKLGLLPVDFLERLSLLPFISTSDIELIVDSALFTTFTCF